MRSYYIHFHRFCVIYLIYEILKNVGIRRKDVYLFRNIYTYRQIYLIHMEWGGGGGGSSEIVQQVKVYLSSLR